MAARTKRRRPRTVAEGLIGKDEYRVLDEGGTVVATKGYRPLALTKAQTLATTHAFAGEHRTYTVERRGLIGPPTAVYRVEADGTNRAVVTITLTRED